MDRVVDFVVDGLAVYRLTRLVQEDSLLDGPRDRALDRWGHRKAVELLTCPYCASVWLALAVVAARAALPRPWGAAARVLAFSAVAGLLSER